MIISSFQHNFAEVVESSLDFKFKFKLPYMKKLTSTV